MDSTADTIGFAFSKSVVLFFVDLLLKKKLKFYNYQIQTSFFLCSSSCSFKAAMTVSEVAMDPDILTRFCLEEPNPRALNAHLLTRF